MGRYVQHLSVRVPWHDSGWNGHVCRAPRDNTACVLLENIGLKRDDAAEVAAAGAPMTPMTPHSGGPPPCVAERATFMSSFDLTLQRRHPYAWTTALKGLTEAVLPVPAWSVHAVPYFWLARDHVATIQQQQPVPGYQPELEDEALRAIGWGGRRQTWVLHGDNQKALIETFFRDVTVQQSLLFFYLKHSPFEDVGARLLIGAATVDTLTLPGRWPTSGAIAFPNHMWETVVQHTLRPDGTGGILLPMQELAELAAAGTNVSDALAAAPESEREFPTSPNTSRRTSRSRHCSHCRKSPLAPAGWESRCPASRSAGSMHNSRRRGSDEVWCRGCRRSSRRLDLSTQRSTRASSSVPSTTARTRGRCSTAR